VSSFETTEFASEIDSGKEVASRIFIASCDASELFHSIEVTLHEIELGIEGEVAFANTKIDLSRSLSHA
jgi:hypothetical protein